MFLVKNSSAFDREIKKIGKKYTYRKNKDSEKPGT